MRLKALSIFLFIFSFQNLFAQTRVSGKVIDAKTGEPLPFVSLVFKGTTVGTYADFDGAFVLETTLPVDSLQASYVGYKTLLKKVRRDVSQEINFAMEEDNVLEEFVVTPGENPAIAIIKKAQKARDQHDLRSVKTYHYESFNKIQIAVDNFSEKFKEKKVIRQFMSIMDTVSHLSETGTPVLPIFISESISDFFVQNRPLRTKETIKATKLTGVGIEDGSLVSQLLGSTFQQYNFYENWLDILDKKFVSPIGNAALQYYVYDLRDTVELDGIRCYGIKVYKQRKSDLAFEGKIWITDSTYALKRVILEIDDEANINFVERLKIQQELIPTEQEAWMPAKTRVLINIKEISKNTPGMVALFYVSNKDFKLNEDVPPGYFEQPIVVLENAKSYDDAFWDTSRHDALTTSELKVYRMVDTLRNLPIIKTWIDYVDFFFNGYYHWGKIDIGPYAMAYGFNNLEGNRFRIGFRTGEKFSKRWILRGYTAYGTLDERFKFSGQMEYFISRQKWTIFGLKYKDDVEQIGVNDQDYGAGNLFTQLSIFQSNFLNRAYEYKGWISSEFKKGITQKITFVHKQYQFQPIGEFNFAYFTPPENPQAPPGISNYFINSSIAFETRFALREAHLVNGNERYSLGNKGAPVFTIGYTRGLKDIFFSNFDYNRVDFKMEQWVNFGRWGEGDYILTAGKIFDPLPYPLLQVQRGNRSFISSRSAYNLMNFFEFITDEFVALNYEHHFEGLLTNRLPAVKKWKLRIFANVKGVWGSISKENLALMPTADASGRSTFMFRQLNREPYVEVGYGVENIFRFLRIDVIHRMTHRGYSDIQNFGVKGTLQFTF